MRYRWARATGLLGRGGPTPRMRTRLFETGLLRLLRTHVPRAEAGVVVNLPFSPPPRSGALLRGELGRARRTHESEASYITRVRESGLLVPKTRTCTCVDVRAHAGWCADWDWDGTSRVGGLRETCAHLSGYARIGVGAGARASHTEPRSRLCRARARSRVRSCSRCTCRSSRLGRSSRVAYFPRH